MNASPSVDRILSANDLRQLDGRVVLVKSSQDHHNPETAMRGWLEVQEYPDREPEVHIAVDFPQMFLQRAHRQTFPLDHAALMRLLNSERNGAFEYTLNHALE